MPSPLVHLALSVALAISPAESAKWQSRTIDSLRASIGRRIREVKGAVVGVAFRDLATGDTLFINPDESFHAASTMKVPVMIELFRRIDVGALGLDQGILLVNQFGS